MTTLRFPLAGVWGAVCTVALFAVLAHLVNVKTDVPPPLVVDRIDFRRQVIETPVETKRERKVQRTTPPPTPGTPRIGLERGTGNPATPLVRPAVDIRAIHDGHRTMGTDRDVQPIVQVHPDYPQSAISRGVEGWVKVQFTIAPTGAVKDAFVVDASPRAVFDDAALKAIARWRYNPRVEDGTAVERVGMQTVIRFELDNTF